MQNLLRATSRHESAHALLGWYHGAELKSLSVLSGATQPRGRCDLDWPDDLSVAARVEILMAGLCLDVAFGRELRVDGGTHDRLLAISLLEGEPQESRTFQTLVETDGDFTRHLAAAADRGLRDLPALASALNRAECEGWERLLMRHAESLARGSHGALNILLQNWSRLEKLTEQLLEHGELSGESAIEALAFSGSDECELKKRAVTGVTP